MSELTTRLKKLAQARAKLKKLTGPYKAAEAAYEQARIDVLGQMNQEGLNSVRGAGISCGTASKQIVRVVDWDKFYAYIHRTKAYDLLQRRPAVTAILSRIEDGKRLPVTTESIRSLTVKEDKT